MWIDRGPSAGKLPVRLIERVEVNPLSRDETQVLDAVETRRKSGLRETAEAVITALVLALVIRTFVIQAFKIPSGSMLETLQIGDHILVNKLLLGTPVDLPFTSRELFHTPRFTDPEHGDVVVFKFPQDPDRDFIKRVIGVPGDRIEIRNKVVYRNGEPLDEPYVVHKDPNVRPAGDPRDNVAPFVVPEGKYFMMGDNRDYSLDSRFWGFVDRDMIRGKALILYWSWNAEADLLGKVRWSRIGRLVH